MRKMSRNAFVLALAVTIACSHEVFDPEIVDLDDRWDFSIDDDVENPPPVNPCQVRGWRMYVSGNGSSQSNILTLSYSGTIRCQNNGVWGDTAAYAQTFGGYLYRTGPDIIIASTAHDTIFVGRLTSSDDMSGTLVSANWFGRKGTWSAHRF